MAESSLILDWQNALPVFGIPYTGSKDGKMNQSLMEAMMVLENKYKAYGQIFTGSDIKMSVDEAKNKFLGADKSKEKIPQETPKEVQQDSSLKKWESFLSQQLPVVGKLYQGDLATAGKRLETAIAKSIDKPMNGVIWNDTTHNFNTTVEDIKKALELIQAHKTTEIKAAQFTIDQRVAKMSQMLLEKNSLFFFYY